MDKAVTHSSSGSSPYLLTIGYGNGEFVVWGFFGDDEEKKIMVGTFK